MPLFKKLDRNESGRDFVVGDVHGCFDRLRALLQLVGFNENTDRLLSVGDLVDRGPSSHEAVDWLEKRWFFAVRGNHEQMAIEAAPGLHMIDKFAHVNNGGAWFYGLTPEQQARVAIAFNELPYAIEVDTGNESVGLVHAEVPGDDWTAFRGFLELAEVTEVLPANFDHMERFALWGRDIIRGRSPFIGVAGIYRVFVGHTPVNDWQIFGNVHYIDTGAVYGRRLTMICLQSGQVIQH